MISTRVRFLLLILAAGGLSPAVAYAQAQLTGTFVTYVAVGANGAMVDSTRSHSMQYQESSTGPTTCDLYYPGSPQEGFTVQGTSPAGDFAVSTDGTFGGGFTTSTPTAVTGRVLSWSGTYTGTSGVALRVDESFTYALDDRVVTTTIVVNNTGTADLTSVYYLRTGDPDLGQCSIGTSYSTNNDVVLQPPTDDSALATAGAGDMAGPGRYEVVGIGAHDMRARVNNGGFLNTDGRTEWNAPNDDDGVLEDAAVDIVFKADTIMAGTSATFVYYYVWGPDQTTVEARFADLAVASCSTADGTACTGLHGPGTCRSSICCEGCWDGTRCHRPGTTVFCGVGGTTTCTDCTDTDPCTTDVCSTTDATCSHPLSPAGSPCDDGVFCTTGDSCTATGTCVSGTGNACDDRNTCTADTCTEVGHMCSHAPDPTVCNVFGTCYAAGTPAPFDNCEYCDPSMSATAFTFSPTGTPCGTSYCVSGMFTSAPTCNGTGTCMAGTHSTCPTGACDGILACAMPDAGPPDLGPPDLGPPDLGPPDLGPTDMGIDMMASTDLGPPDLGSPDAPMMVFDMGPVDAGLPDAAVADAGFDAGAPDAGDHDAAEDASALVDVGPRVDAPMPDGSMMTMGGGCCAVAGTDAPQGALFALGLVGLLVVRRRRRS